MSTRFDEYVAAVDVGTTKICAVIARLRPEKVSIYGIGTVPSKGLKKGVVVDLQAASESIREAVEIAQKSAGVVVRSAVVGISGSHIRSFNSRGMITISGRDVTQRDIDKVIEVAKAIVIPEGREILHVIPQYFRIDGREFVYNSVGMHGHRLETSIHIVTGAVSSAKNIVRACEMAGFSVEEIVLEQIASAEAVLTETEKEIGAAILDIGGGTSDLAIYRGGKIRFSKVIPIAGNHFTSDLAIGLSMGIREAEDVKRTYGSVLPLDSSKRKQAREKFDAMIAGKVYDILRPRAEELFDIVMDELISENLIRLVPGGLVLTGGGAMLDGMCDLAEELTGMHARIGAPVFPYVAEIPMEIPEQLFAPIYSTAVGLAIIAARHRMEEDRERPRGGVLSSIVSRMRSWISSFV